LGAKLFGIAALVIAAMALVPIKLTDATLDFSYGLLLLLCDVSRLSLGENLGEQALEGVEPRVLSTEIVTWSGVVDVDDPGFERGVDELSRLLFCVDRGFSHSIRPALGISIHFLSPEKSEVSGALPKNVFDSTLPLFLSLVVIVLTLRWTETSTHSSFDW
jgi:hypothetical protein